MTTPLQHTSLGELNSIGPLSTTSLGELGVTIVASATAPSYQQLLSECRGLLQDTDSSCYRYPDSMLLNILNRGLDDLYRIRPDAWYEYYGVWANHVPEITDATITDLGQVEWTEAFHIDLRFYPALVQYVVGMTSAVEDPHVESGKVEWHLQLFRTLVLNT